MVRGLVRTLLEPARERLCWLWWVANWRSIATGDRETEMVMRIYVGCKGGTYEVFKAEAEPTAATYGAQFRGVIGPFRTMRAARFMANPAARNNPHVLNVADAERISKQLRGR